MAIEWGREDFEVRVKQGLKISHGLNLDILPDEELPFILPRAPVAFGLVTESAAVEAHARPGINCMSVSFKATWSVRLVKPSNHCHIFLAVPAPMPAGILDVISIEVPNSSKPDLKACSTYLPMFDDVYLIDRPQVDGGAKVCAYFNFIVKLFPSPSGVLCFSIPFCSPFYTKGFYGDKQKEKEETPFSGSPFKIKLFIWAKEGQIISEYSYNFPLQVVETDTGQCRLCRDAVGWAAASGAVVAWWCGAVVAWWSGRGLAVRVIMEYEDCIILLQELEGPDMEWPEGILTC
ncbi:hypothetical protein Cgig2_010741 [Carnegiea gigantea]|uniref:Uncharacterized protein n=1 Tax=Carnegiea gigantea TaxID=171969 RepID=A0A9Q1KMA9_9CARY|nr:hypothetical protein Cgig2_010741 [Carnegiea gigantea]